MCVCGGVAGGGGGAQLLHVAACLAGSINLLVLKDPTVGRDQLERDGGQS